MKRNLMFGICMVLGMALAAEARDWGFSKDTVYEWSPGGDTVYLVNSGSDTLVLDSVRAIDVDTSEWSETWFYYHPFEGFAFVFNVSQPSGASRAREVPEDIRLLPPGESAMFREFIIGPPPIASKKQLISVSEPGDTIKMGIRILTEGGEEDTVIVVGIFDYGTSLTPISPIRLEGERVLLDRDLKGRRIKPAGNHPVLER